MSRLVLVLELVVVLAIGVGIWQMNSLTTVYTSEHNVLTNAIGWHGLPTIVRP